MRRLLFTALLFVNGCTANKPVPVALNPTPTIAPTIRPTPKSTTSPKAKLTPAADPEDVFRARSLDGRFEATGTLFRVPEIHGFVEVREVKTKRVLWFWNAPQGVTGLSFSPNGKMLVVIGSGRLTVWNWRAKKVMLAQSLDTRGQFRVESAFSPSGKQLAVAYGDLMVFDVATWKSRRFPQPGEPAFVDNVTWSPDGRLLALTQHDLVAFSLVDVRSGKAGGLGATDAESEPLFSPDSRLLAGATNEGTFIWRTANGARKFLGGTYDHPLVPISFSPDARFLVVKKDNLFEVWRVRDSNRVLVAPRDTSSLLWLDSRTLELKSGKTTKRVPVL